METFKINLKANYFFLFIFFLICLFYFVNLISAHIYLENSVLFKPLLSNYSGGFIRRGLLGEIATELSFKLQINIKFIFFLFFFLANFTFLFYFYKILKNLEKNAIFFFFIFSPLGFVFPLTNYETTFFGENFLFKEIFVLSFFIYYSELCKNSNNDNNKLIVGTTGLIILTFIYELTILFYPFFFFVFYISLKNKLDRKKFYKILFVSLILSLIVLIHIFLHGKYNFEILYQDIYKKFFIVIDDNDWWYGNWAKKSIFDQLIFLREDFNFRMCLRYLLYSHPIILLTLYLLKNTNEKKVKYFFLFSIISSSLLFFIALDWARFLYIIYTFVLISFLQFFLQSKENKNLKIFSNIYSKTFLNKIKVKYINIFVALYCFSWSLKLTYWQNHYSFGPIKTIMKHFSFLLKQL